jgi:uncharacterized protein involved in type VI secretion and phage assembly
VKVKFPTLADDLESHWCRLVTPMAGAERGIFILPEVNDEVLVAFDHGSHANPVILGSLWNGSDKPPLTKSMRDGRVVQRVIKPGRPFTSLDDKEGERASSGQEGQSARLRMQGRQARYQDGRRHRDRVFGQGQPDLPGRHERRSERTSP